MENDFKKYLTEHLKTQPNIVMPKFEYNKVLKLVLEADNDIPADTDKPTPADTPADTLTDTPNDDLNPPENLNDNPTDNGEDFGGENNGSEENGGGNEDFGGDMGGNGGGGGSLFGNGGNGGEKDNKSSNKDGTITPEKEIPKDAEFSAGTTDGKDLSLTKTPPSAVTVNFEDINTILNAYTTTTQDTSLLDTLSQLKKINTDLSTGKKLTAEDVKFDDANSLKIVLKYLKSKLKIDDFNYLTKKIKEPLNNDMVQQKEEIAKTTTDKKANVDNLMAVNSI